VDIFRSDGRADALVTPAAAAADAAEAFAGAGADEAVVGVATAAGEGDNADAAEAVGAPPLPNGPNDPSEPKLPPNGASGAPLPPNDSLPGDGSGPLSSPPGRMCGDGMAEAGPALPDPDDDPAAPPPIPVCMLTSSRADARSRCFRVSSSRAAASFLFLASSYCFL